MGRMSASKVPNPSFAFVLIVAPREGLIKANTQVGRNILPLGVVSNCLLIDRTSIP